MVPIVFGHPYDYIFNDKIMIVCINVFKLIGRVNVKNEKSVRVEIIMHTGKAPFQVAVLCEIVNAVETTANCADRSVKLKVLHILTKE